MSNLRDIRTPADPQDFESLYDRPAKPPLDFRIIKSGGTLRFEFQDFAGIPERDPTVAYRAYFIPESVASLTERGKLDVRRAALRLGRLAVAVPASGRGEWVSGTDPTYYGADGFFLAVGVNRRNVESEPTIPYVPSGADTGGISISLGGNNYFPGGWL